MYNSAGKPSLEFQETSTMCFQIALAHGALSRTSLRKLIALLRTLRISLISVLLHVKIPSCAYISWFLGCNIEYCRTDALEPGLRSFPGRSERLVLRFSAAHADLDSCRNECAVTEAGRWVIARRRGRGVGRRQRQRLSAGTSHVRDANKTNRRRTLRFLDEVHSSVNVLWTPTQTLHAYYSTVACFSYLLILLSTFSLFLLLSLRTYSLKKELTRLRSENCIGSANGWLSV